MTTYHKECKKADLMAASTSKPANKGLIDMHISEANRKKANHIGKLLLQVYTDAKILTSSAYSWPSRFVASESGKCFNFNASSFKTIPDNINIQYVTPAGHLSLLTAITRSHNKLIAQVENALAISIHIDGSVDRFQIDIIYYSQVSCFKW